MRLETEAIIAARNRMRQRVNHGVKLLDEKVPGWRRTIRNNREQYDFKRGSCCVLGTLEHFNGMFQTIRASGADSTEAFLRAKARLGIHNASNYGFDWGNEYGDGIKESDELAKIWDEVIDNE